mgnify:CR=1 FL=1
MDGMDVIVKKAKQGDDEAFTKLIDVNKVKLYKIAYMYVKNEQDALDILSDTICKSYKSIKKLKDPKFFNTWLFRILINTATDKTKNNKKIIYIDDYEKIKSEFTDKMCESDFNIPANIDLYRAIDTLDIKYKNIVILKYFQDMTIAQISKILNHPEGTIKVYLFRALKKLKIQLKEEYI